MWQGIAYVALSRSAIADKYGLTLWLDRYFQRQIAMHEKSVWRLRSMMSGCEVPHSG